MNPSRLVQKGMLFCRNVTAKKYPVQPEDAHALLERIWPDVGSSCFLPRSKKWQNPENPVDVSVIIATYNNADYICGSVESVLHQKTEHSFEVIVINDGSTDETARLLHPYEALSNVRVVHQANAGHSGARNVGIDLCRGRYLLFHDGDDTLLPDALENLLACAEANHADVVAGGYLCKVPGGEPYPGLLYPAGKVDDPETIPGMTCGKIYRRKLFANLAFPDKYWYEDSIISQIVLPLANGCYAVHEPVFTYLLNQSGVSFTSQGKVKSIDSLYVTEALLREREKFGLPMDAYAYRHFLHMVLLTYHRTSQLSPKVLYGIFLCQRQLLQTYFQGMTCGGEYAGLEAALTAGNYRKYLWCCETQWILQMRKR